ncbi:hypothetical protein J6590_050263 [Homalodisca vitripennis]|nr:hypothetical protein J6590_050263 [Homalodisca vitripennis]
MIIYFPLSSDGSRNPFITYPHPPPQMSSVCPATLHERNACQVPELSSSLLPDLILLLLDDGMLVHFDPGLLIHSCQNSYDVTVDNYCASSRVLGVPVPGWSSIYPPRRKTPYIGP